MDKLQIYKKPELAILSDERKLRSYNDVERLTIAKGIVENLLNSLGVSNKSNEEHHIEAIRYIASNKEFSPGEFKKAFELVMTGVLKIELYQQVNCLIIGKVMNLYKNHKIENLKLYKQKMQLEENKQKELSSEEKKELLLSGIKSTFEEFKSNGSIPVSRLYLYYEFFKIEGILLKDNVTKKAVYKIACERIKKRPVVTKEDKMISNIIGSNGQPNIEVLNECKRITLERLFNKFTVCEQLLMKIK